MGPILLFDKSAFQALSRDEHVLVDIYFMENLAPILPMELLGDLAKRFPDGRPPSTRSQSLLTSSAGAAPQ